MQDTASLASHRQAGAAPRGRAGKGLGTLRLRPDPWAAVFLGRGAQPVGGGAGVGQAWSRFSARCSGLGDSGQSHGFIHPFLRLPVKTGADGGGGAFTRAHPPGAGAPRGLHGACREGGWGSLLLWVDAEQAPGGWPVGGAGRPRSSHRSRAGHGCRVPDCVSRPPWTCARAHAAAPRPQDPHRHPSHVLEGFEVTAWDNVVKPSAKACPRLPRSCLQGAGLSAERDAPTLRTQGPCAEVGVEGERTLGVGVRREHDRPLASSDGARPTAHMTPVPRRTLRGC